MGTLIALLAGLVFGAGLMLSGMVLPAKVLAFLDVTGAWDPSLGLVMLGALLVAVLAYRLARGRVHSWLGFHMSLPTRRDIDGRLIAGGTLFGIGWGLVGLCPGPALVNLGTAQPRAIAFFLAMIAGMIIFEYVEHRRATRAAGGH